MVKDKKFCVYKHTSPSGKVYIGITSQKPKSRWGNGKKYTKSRYFENAINKYGWQNIKSEVLYENLDREVAYTKEIELIEQYKSNDRRFGYNIDNGGQVNKISNETKKIFKKITSDRLINPANHPMAKKVDQYGMDHNFIMTWSSMIEASHELKIPKNKIGKVCSGACDSAGGFYWAYHGEMSKFHTFNSNKLNLDQYRIDNDKIATTGEKTSKYHTKKVKQIDMQNGNIIHEYNSISEAMRQTGINNISAVCNKTLKSAGGYYWQFFDENREFEIYKIRGRIVKQIDANNGEIIGEFISMAEASNQTGVNASCISDVIHNRQKTAGGFLWESVEYISQLKNKKSSMKAVNQIDLDSGEIIRKFNSITEASEVTNIYSSNISSVLSGGGRSAGGFYWAYDGIKFKLPPTKFKKIKQIDVHSNEVICKFNSIREASKLTNISKQSISVSCRNIDKIAGGFNWEYCD